MVSQGIKQLKTLEVKGFMELKLKLALQHDVINGFSYSYCRALLEKLKALKVERRVFEDNEKAAECDESLKKGEGYFATKLTPIAYSVIDALDEQIEGFRLGDIPKPSQVDAAIAVAEEFLAIFEKKP